MPTLLSLFVEKGPKAGLRLECKPSAVTTVGRARSNTIQISKDSGISQNHLRFKWTGGGSCSSDKEDAAWIVEDVGSSNGTILNDFPIEAAKPTAVRSGDLIKIGAETTIRIDVISPAVPQALSEVKSRGASRRKEAPSTAGRNNPKKKPGNVAKVPENVAKKPENVVVKELDMIEALPSTLGDRVEGDDADLNATVEQWFRLMMDGGRDYIYKISESIIQDIMLESERFDESVRSM